LVFLALPIIWENLPVKSGDKCFKFIVESDFSEEFLDHCVIGDFLESQAFNVLEILYEFIWEILAELLDGKLLLHVLDLLILLFFCVCVDVLPR